MPFQPRVAVVAASLDILGGQGVQARSLVDALENDGYPVTFLPVNPRFPRGLQWLRSHRYFRTVANQALYVPSLARLSATEVAHVFSASYSSFLLAPVPAMAMARLLGKRVVLHYHSGEADDHLAKWGVLVHPWLRLADEIVVPSEYLAGVFAAHGYRTRVIPNVVDLSRFIYRERRALRPHLISTRNLEPYYRVDVVLRAFALVKAQRPDATLTVAGYGSLESRLRELAIDGVRFAGRVSPEMMPQLLAETDIFLNASVVDNQPVSILEAFAAGLPVVSTSPGDIPAMVRHKETGLIVPPNDPQALADAVLRLIDTPDDALRMARRARRLVARHTWSAVRDQWTEVYAEQRNPPASHGSARPGGNAFRRIRQMALAEIACRSRQQASKWLERLKPSGPDIDPVAVLRAHAPGLAQPDFALRALHDKAPHRFFAGIADTNTPSVLRTRLPEACAAIVTAADTLMDRRFDLLGYQQLSFGDPIDWHLDPVGSRRAPLRHWSSLDPLDSQVVGDSKVVWELNRHQWVVRLAQAWVITGDTRYATACIDAIDAWIDANPPGLGINWASSLEVAYRLMSWCWVILLLRHAPVLSGRWAMKLLAAMVLHAKHVRRYLSYYFSPNTHLTGEALGLFYAGSLLQECRDAKTWRDLGADILLKESRAQVSADGVHFEQSTCYQRYTAETYLQFILLAARNDVTLPDEINTRVQLMVEFLAAVRRPDGSIPAIGDSDGGELTPLMQRSPDDGRGIFGVAAALFERSDFAWAAEGLSPEVVWLTGADGLLAFDALQAAPSKGNPSRVFRNGGYAVLRSGWEPEAHQLIADVGPLGCRISGGHGHADLLSIQCAAFGEPFLVDPGTYCYTAEGDWRNFFRSTGAHSTVLVDKQDHAQPSGPFRWHQRPTARLREWRSDTSCDYVDAEHDAYSTLSDPVRCRRRVVFVKPHYWLVVDDLTGTSSHHIDLAFQFAPMNVTLEQQSWVRAESPKGHVLWVSTFPSAGVHRTLACGDLNPIRGWVSTNYGQRQPSPMLIYSSKTTLPWRALTLLWPDSQRSGVPPSVTAIFDEDGRPAGLTFNGSHASVHFNDQAVLLSTN